MPTSSPAQLRLRKLVGTVYNQLFALVLCLSLLLSKNVCLFFFFFFLAEGKRFKPDIKVVHVRDLNFVLRRYFL